MLRNVLIKSVLNGWIVEVGCQEVVFVSLDGLLGTLRHYLEHPEGTEQQFREQAVNAKWTWGTDEVREVGIDEEPTPGSGEPPHLVVRQGNRAMFEVR